MAEWSIEALSQEHERGAFCCGKAPLDAFIRQHAAKNMERGISRVFVAVRPGEKRILGFYAAAAGTFQRDNLPKKGRQGLPGYPIPTAHLGRLAVDQTCQGQGLGETLLFHFLSAALEVSQKLGVFAVDIWSKDEVARKFYLKYGFLTLQDDPLHLYLPIGTVQQMFEKD